MFFFKIIIFEGFRIGKVQYLGNVSIQMKNCDLSLKTLHYLNIKCQKWTQYFFSFIVKYIYIYIYIFLEEYELTKMQKSNLSYILNLL